MKEVVILTNDLQYELVEKRKKRISAIENREKEISKHE